MWIPRQLRASLERAAATRPGLLLTGARQTGKSSLLRRTFPALPYVALDRVAVAMEAEENPARFLERFDGPVILDEIQYAPSLFRELKLRIDAERAVTGRWLLTGSQRFELMAQASESLAGRLRVLHLETLGAGELRQASELDPAGYVWRGGYPELWAVPELVPSEFYEDYLATYLDRDLTQLVHVSNRRDFRRLLQACAVRAGQLLNLADLGRDVGIAADTVRRWLAALEAGGLVTLLPPYFANLGKRLTKAPKLFFADHGLLCHLVNAGSAEAWYRHPLRGQLWENLVFGELVKTVGMVSGRSLFFYRDQNAVEVDFLVDQGAEIILVEAKAAEQPATEKLNFAKLQGLLEPRVGVRCVLACMTAERQPIQRRDYTMVNPLFTPLIAPATQEVP